MEIFIDLDKITESQPIQDLPGISLNLSGLIDPKQSSELFNINQTPLKTETEFGAPGFNPMEYFDQIQQEFLKIKDAQFSLSTDDDVKTFQQAQQNSNLALDPLASYLEKRFNTLETITNDNFELRQLIQGVSDNTLSGIQSVINSPLSQIESIERTNSIEILTNSISNLLEKNETLTLPKENLIEVSPVSTLLNEVSPVSTLLNTTQETTFDQTSQNVSNLSETVSNFATNLLSGTNLMGSINLPEPVKGPLQIKSEIAKPDFGFESLSALRQIAETGASLVNNSIVNTNSTSAITNNTTNSDQIGPGVMLEPTQPTSNPSVLMTGGSDMSSVYLMQMLNILKSGQLKVKLS